MLLYKYRRLFNINLYTNQAGFNSIARYHVPPFSYWKHPHFWFKIYKLIKVKIQYKILVYNYLQQKIGYVYILCNVKRDCLECHVIFQMAKLTSLGNPFPVVSKSYIKSRMSRESLAAWMWHSLDSLQPWQTMSLQFIVVFLILSYYICFHTYVTKS